MVFDKRTLRSGELRRHLAGAPSLLFKVASAYGHQRLAPAFSEKLMLVVTSVLQCRYCNWVHSELATRFGVEPADIEALLAGDLSVAPPDERPALAYALEYAASEGALPDSELEGSYPAAVARDTHALVEFVALTNKVGNTFDAFLGRLQGQPASDSSVAIELGVAMMMAPVYSAAGVITRKGRNPFVTLKS